jgi:hypothetical protein
MTDAEEVHAILLLEEIATLLKKVADMIGRACPSTVEDKRCIIHTWDPTEHDREMAAIRRKGACGQ